MSADPIVRLAELEAERDRLAARVKELEKERDEARSYLAASPLAVENARLVEHHALVIVELDELVRAYRAEHQCLTSPHCGSTTIHGTTFRPCSRARWVIDRAETAKVALLKGKAQANAPRESDAAKVDPDAERFLTSGQRANLSLAEHRQRLRVLFEENEARPLPDTALRVALLDADRVADEYASDKRANEQPAPEVKDGR